MYIKTATEHNVFLILPHCFIVSHGSARKACYGIALLYFFTRLENRLTDGGEVSVTLRPRVNQKQFFCFWYSFLLETE
jgi:hypothetical protein